MTYLARFFSWAFKTLWELAMEIFMFSIRQVISIIRFAAPYVIRTAVFCLGLMVQMSLLNFLALVRPIPEVARKTGEEWSKKAVEEGLFPSLHQLTLTRILIITAYIAMTGGLVMNVSLILFTGILIGEIGILLSEHGSQLINVLHFGR